MSRKIRRTRQAGDDIIRAYLYVHDRSPSGAERLLAAIERSIRRLLDTRGVGRHWNSADPRLEGVRVTTVTPYRNYLIFFRAVSTGIEMLRVVHGAQDLQPLVD